MKVNIFQLSKITKIILSILDVNECANSNPCGEGICFNTFGSFRCDCKTGYRPGSDQVCEGRSSIN